MREDDDSIETIPDAQSPKDVSPPRLSETGVKAMQGTSDGGNWMERGIVDVPVADLPASEGVNSPEDFDHHITHDDAVESLKRLQDIKPLVDQGYTGDDFYKLDQANRLDYAHGQQRIYDLYYGDDAIRLTKDGDKYDITHGRHRIFAAKELGLKTIPASVVERSK